VRDRAGETVRVVVGFQGRQGGDDPAHHRRPHCQRTCHSGVTASRMSLGFVSAGTSPVPSAVSPPPPPPPLAACANLHVSPNLHFPCANAKHVRSFLPAAFPAL
jgi:hypothetical protein